MGKRGRKPSLEEFVVTCDFCGKENKRYASQMARRNHHFCNRNCYLRFMIENSNQEIVEND